MYNNTTIEQNLKINAFDVDYKNQIVTVDLYADGSDEDIEPEAFTFDEYEEYLDKNNYLKGSGEEFYGVNTETGADISQAYSWDFEVEDFFDYSSELGSNVRIEEVMTNFLNERRNGK